MRDQPVIAIDKARYVGDPVAAVVAVDERTALAPPRQAMPRSGALEPPVRRFSRDCMVARAALAMCSS